MYSKKKEIEIVKMVCGQIDEKSDIASFYQNPILNYKSCASDTKRLLSEIISEVLLDNFRKIETIGDKIQIRDTKSFNLEHGGYSNVDARKKRFGYLKYSEKLLAIALFNSKANHSFGKIFDYEIPLKEKQKDNFGKIDIVAKSKNIIKLIELKIHKKTDETLLRALLEIYTYYKLLSNRRDKFLNEYRDGLGEEKNYIFQPVILTDENSHSGKMIVELNKYPMIKKLIERLGLSIGVPVELYLYSFPSQGLDCGGIRDGKEKIIFKNVNDIQIRKVSIIK